LDREREKEREAESRFGWKRVNESDTDYYCRVIGTRAHKPDFVYHRSRIKIVGSAMEGNGRILFAVAGPYDVVKRLERGLIITKPICDAGRPLVGGFKVLPDATVCGKPMYFIQSVDCIEPSTLEKASSVHVEIPSQRVGFAMKIWKLQ